MAGEDIDVHKKKLQGFLSFGQQPTMGEETSLVKCRSHLNFSTLPRPLAPASVS